VRCRWRTNVALSQAWRVDLRLDGEFEQVNEDLPPLDGRLPTFKWTPGLAVEDDLRVFVPPDAEPGPARLSIGWERYGDGAIAMDGGGERYPLGEVTVLPPLFPYDPTSAGGEEEDVPSEDPEAEGPQPPR